MRSGCIFQAQNFCFDPCDGYSISVDNSGNISCNGGSDGFVDVSTGICTIWNWLDGAPGGDRYNMSAGTYTLVATSCDPNYAGCVDTLTITITEPAIITATMLGGPRVVEQGNNLLNL